MKHIFTVLVIFSVGILAAQPPTEQLKFEVKGKVVDKGSGLPLEFATVSLHAQADSSLINGAVTDATGVFKLAPPAGEYFLKAQFISYKTRVIKNIIVNRDNKKVDLGTIEVAEDTETLDEVVIKAQRSQMQLELDKRVFDVAQNVNNIGANATEILDNIPSVAVDVEGNVSLRGSSNVRILINGKPSGLVGINDQNGLRQLQGDIIERIEVVTNPSARYDAEGTGGIINIILKKQRDRGFNGAFTLNTGVPQNYGFSGNANYRTQKFNFFASYGINYRENPGGGFTDRVSYGEDTTFTFIDNDRVRSGLSHNVRLGADFYINDNNIITASAVTRISDEENTTDLTYFDRDINQNLFYNTLRQDVEIEDDRNTEYQLNYQRIMKGSGHEFNFQFQYRDSDETEDSSIGEADLLTNESLAPYQQSLNDQFDRNVLIQADYVYPFGDGKKFETGYRGTLREISSDYNVEERDENGDFRPIEEVFQGFQFSNFFIYEEDVHAAYAIFENKMDKWGYQLGMRLEQTSISTYQRVGDQLDEKNYLNAFPSAFVSYKLDKERTLQASYSRRLSRPRFWYLNPFSSFSDPRNIRSGNTDLDPEYTDSYEVGLLNNLNKSSWYIGGYYRYTTGKIERLSVPGEFAGNPATITTPYNLGIEDAYGIEMNFTADFTNWFSLNGNANFYRAMTTGSFNDEDLSRDATTANFRLNSQFKIGGFNIQLSGNYRAPEQDVQGRRKAFYSVDLGANKDVLNGQGTITLSARDLFNTRKYRGILETPTLVEDREFQWRSRQVRLSFTYRINQKKQRGRGDGDYDGGDGDY